MNNPIFIFSLDSIIEYWFDYCCLKNHTFHKSTSKFCFFFFFFAASNQCNRPDLLENTMVKLRSVYVRWLAVFDPRSLSVALRLRSVYLLPGISRPQTIFLSDLRSLVQWFHGSINLWLRRCAVSGLLKQVLSCRACFLRTKQNGGLLLCTIQGG